MRNLKRALSLAVSTVMLMGMMVVGSGAAGYDDVSSEHNQEAIDVLQAIGVMVGDGENFNPDQNVTREEMAVIMCQLLDYTVSSYQGLTRFTDVSDWARPYVEACYTNGIIAGYSDTQFGGADPVTTGQTGLMIMKALGYFQEMGDFGSDWLVATVREGSQIQLFAGVPNGASEALTRNDVAQMVLNALQAEVVEIVRHDLSAGIDGELTTKAVYGARARVPAWDTIDIGSTSGGLQLGEELYEGDLALREVEDAFGRPSSRWVYRVNEIGVYSDDPIATYTAKASKGDLYTLLGSSAVNDLTVVSNFSGDGDELVAYVDGAVVSDAGDPITDYFDRNSSAGGHSGKGVLTEVYQDNDNNVTLVFVNTYLMQATGDYNEDSESVNVAVLTGVANDNDLNLDEFDNITGLVEDDYILYTYANGEVQTVQPAEVLTGNVSAYSVGVKSDNSERDTGDATGSVTIDGTQYDYAKWAETDAENGCATTFNVGSAANLALDPYGYVLYVDDATLSVGNYVYIDAFAKETNLSTTDIADAYRYDGSNSTITVRELRDAAGHEIGIDYPTGETRTENDQGWYSFSRNSSDEYTLTLAETSSVIDVTSGTVQINNRVALFTDTNLPTGSQTVTGNSSTVFVVKDEDNDLSVYTGITNVPDITVGDQGGHISYMKDKDDDSKTVASLVFVDVGDNGSVKNSVTSLLYTVKLDNTRVDNEDNQEIDRWIVVLDGEETTVEATQDWSPRTAYVDYSTDSDGYYEEGTTFRTEDNTDDDLDTLEMTMASGAEIVQSGDTLSFVNAVSDKASSGYGTSFVVNSDTQITLIMHPLAKTGALSNQVMRDNNADYQIIENIGASILASRFRDRTVTGTVYVVYDDENSSDLLDRVYVVVNECSALGTTSDDDDVDYDVDGQVISPMSTVAYVNERLAEGNVVIEGTWTPDVGGTVVIPANTTLKIEGNLNAETEGLTIAAVSSSSLVVTGYYEHDYSSNINYNVTAGSIQFGVSNNTTPTITGDVVIENNATVIGAGELIIAEGATVTIGGNLTKANDDSNATVTVNGTLYVNGNEVSDGDLELDTTVNSSESLHVAGDMKGALTIGVANDNNNVGYAVIGGEITGTVKVNNGQLVVNGTLNSNSVTGSAGGQITFGASATVTGDEADKFTNGTATVDSVANQTFTFEGESESGEFVNDAAPVTYGTLELFFVTNEESAILAGVYDWTNWEEMGDRVIQNPWLVMHVVPNSGLGLTELSKENVTITKDNSNTNLVAGGGDDQILNVGENGVRFGLCMVKPSGGEGDSLEQDHLNQETGEDNTYKAVVPGTYEVTVNLGDEENPIELTESITITADMLLDVSTAAEEG